MYSIVCCSSAAAGCKLSAFGFVHTELRNRLKDRVEKLVFLFFIGKNIVTEDNEMTERYEESMRICSAESTNESDSE